ncbi:ABC transporter ATP-binding protein [Bacillus massiliigorillae]|uniref:ABC transporter ATP-binding protein n=1 Tax=Bacillus massiliigorillae TaxID=1243664 RepID=UPI0003A6690E|nr:ATP-binding cassette domain-containing protein [Bacillus massiliigorillae]
MITLNNITVNKRGKKILSVNHLTVVKGEVTGLIGPNGAGKSTLLKTMALLENQVEGELKLKGDVMSVVKPSLENRRLFSFVFQQPLMLDTNVFNNVASGLKIRGIDKQEIKRRVEQWLEKLSISHLHNRHARSLSGGEAQRVALARALVTEPEILFLDEPFSALDLPTKRRIMSDLKAILAQTHITTIFISHDYQEITYLCEQAIVLYNGEMIGKYKLVDLPLSHFTKPLQTFITEWKTPLLEHYYG